MTYSRAQLANFRAAFASLSVVGPEWSIPPWPDRPTRPMKPAKRIWQRTASRMISAFGRTQTVVQWANETQIPPETIRSRIDTYHWSAEDALSKKQKPRPGQPMRIRK